MQQETLNWRAMAQLFSLAAGLICLAGCAGTDFDESVSKPIMIVRTLDPDDGIVLADDAGPTMQLCWVREVTVCRRHDHMLRDDKGRWVSGIPLLTCATGIRVDPDGVVLVRYDGRPTEIRVGQIIVVTRSTFDNLLRNAPDYQVMYRAPRRNASEKPILQVEYLPWPSLD